MVGLIDKIIHDTIKPAAIFLAKCFELNLLAFREMVALSKSESGRFIAKIAGVIVSRCNYESGLSVLCSQTIPADVFFREHIIRS